MARKLPKLVNKFCYGHNAWIVGGAAIEDNPKDYDVAIPFSEWQLASMLIPENAKPNSFGGWKFTSEGESVDVWPCELLNLLKNEMVTHLWHPKSGLKLKKTD